MGLTQVSTGGIEDGSIVNADLHSAANIASSKLADSGVSAATYGSATAIPAIVINAKGIITSASTNNISTDLVDDTSPQLGGDLQSNGNDIDFADGDKAVFGSSSDLEIFHSGSHSFIRDSSGTGNLKISSNQIDLVNAGNSEFMAKFIEDGAVELYHNHVKKFNTKSDGVLVTGELQATTLDINGSSHLDGTAVVTGNLDMPDNAKILLGTGDDIEIFHDSTNSFLKNNTNAFTISTETANAALYLKSDALRLWNSAGNEQYIVADKNSAVEIYYDNVKKFETTSTGISVTGNIVGSNHLELADNKEVRLGDSQDLQIYHSGFNYIESHNDKEVHINAYTGGAAENMAKFKPNGAVELYHNNVKKFETKSDGVDITGELQCDSLDVDGAATFTGADVTFQGANYNAFWDQSASQFQIEDNAKIVFGSSQDLQIIHNGNSLITNTAGQILIRSTTGLQLGSTSGEIYLAAVENAQVGLYYNNSQKLETLSGGVQVNGTCTATTFSGSGASLTNIPAPANAAFAWINFNSTNNSIRGSYNVSSISDHGTGNFSVNFSNNASNNNYAVQINGTNTTSNTAISFLLSASGPNLNSNAYSDGNFSTSSFRWVMGYGPSSVSMDSNLVCATVHES